MMTGKLIFIAIKLEKNKIIDTLAFKNEDDCEAFCTQFQDWECVPTSMTDLKHALLYSVR